MTGLLQNEWIKIRKQTGYRVFLILFAVVVLLVAPGQQAVFGAYERFGSDAGEGKRELRGNG